MQDQDASIAVALDALRRAQFGLADVVRRAQGSALGAFGLDPHEYPYRVVGSGSCWRLRDYGDAGYDNTPTLLIVAAPIKRPYIWDLAPSVSAIRYCLRQRWHTYLLEWKPASRHTENCGLDGCVRAISECVAMIAAKTADAKPFLIGHSLGGTLAAIFGTFAP